MRADAVPSRPPVPSASDVAGGQGAGIPVTRGGTDPARARTARELISATPPAASPLWACDGYPVCRFDGTRTDVRNHMRECSHSDAGAIYRVLAWAGAQR